MVAKHREQLGSPDIKLEGLEIWGHGRQFPDAEDFWDGNWLNVTVHCSAMGASVWISGCILSIGEIKDWYTEVEALNKSLKGEAKLQCLEPNLEVILRSDDLGHIKMEVSITPEHMTQKHWFEFNIDQSYLPNLIKQCSDVLELYPIKGGPDKS